jgi:hypothetical protein
MILTSCGIPVVQTLSAPAGVGTQPTSYHSLIYLHSGSAYSASDNFIGYNVYYKIYPLDSGSNLLSHDNDLLTNVTPTVDYLTGSLGYKLLVTSAWTSSTSNQSSDPITATPPPTINLSANNSIFTSQQITLDFSNLIPAGGTTFTSFPAVTISTSLNSATLVNVYRDVTFSANYSTTNVPKTLWTNLQNYYKDWYTVLDPNFWSQNPFVLDNDMQNGADFSNLSITSTSLISGLEVDFFIAAYAWSPATQAVYSRPVPWGVIHLQ